MKKVAILLVSLVLLCSVSVLASTETRTIFEGGAGPEMLAERSAVNNYRASQIFAVYIHTSGGDVQVAVNGNCSDFCSCASRCLLWQEVCRTAIERGLSLSTSDRVIVFYIEKGVEKVAVLAANEWDFTHDYGTTIEA
ncbi:hypothetical protein Theba_0866 [Mesotoga prima MesG1.Ag.4.2]|uniref:Uncharacterized protein n=1 Tax=Mesotoga prima MesG1.Ag.4.2 TaxID=660470 RepID=I2F3S3_9BACT|nr:hypothetical protein [Mesotoga prima]AFK06576.1 hypothetical protein Theba_0866 [Mesotoga prima MesG1.Ag.4.2]